MGILSDILNVSTLRKERDGLATRLKKLETDYSELTSNIAASIIIQNSDYAITFCSPFTEVLTGYSTAEIMSKGGAFLPTIVHHEDIERYNRALKVVALGEPFQARFRFLHKSGFAMWAEMRMVPITEQSNTEQLSTGPDAETGPNEKFGVLSIALDVTATVRYQQQIEERNRDLQDFSYMISHDLKSPIYTIKGMLNVIREDHIKELSQAGSATIDHIERAVLRLEDLVSAVIDYSRVSLAEVQQEQSELSVIFRDILHDYQTSIGERDAVLTVPSQNFLVNGERTRVYQIFSNLVGNALKYSRPDVRPQITISCLPINNGRDLQILVEDNGQGIPAAQLENIFRPFKRANTGKQEGAGIGLAIVQKLCSKLGGSIRVESEVGKGSRFLVVLRSAAN